MRFVVHCANPTTGEEFDWEIDAPTVYDAEAEVVGAGFLVSSTRPAQRAYAPRDRHGSWKDSEIGVSSGIMRAVLILVVSLFGAFVLIQIVGWVLWNFVV